MPEIWQRLDDAGLTTPRGLRRLAAPLPRLPRRRRRRRRDHRRHARRSPRSSGASSATREFSNLPRKFKTALTGHPSHDVRPRRSTTSRSSAPSTPSTAPASTSGSAAACPPTRCSPRSSASGSRSTRWPTSGRAWPSIFRDYGYRRLRSRARLKFLVADWGVEKFREVLENEYLHRALVACDSPGLPGRSPRPHRRARAEGRPVLRRRRPDGRPGHRRDPAGRWPT